MNSLSVLSVIFAVISLLLIGLSMLVSDGFVIAAMASVLVSVYLDHLGIKKDLRDFLTGRGGRP